MLAAIIVTVCAPVILAGAYALYRIAFWRTPADRWEARHAGRIPHITAQPGYELSSYENILRARAASKAEVKS